MTPIYHIKHVNTLAGIVAHGGIWCERQCSLRGIVGVAIGYDHIKARRMQRPVPLPPHGTLGDYVPFYFAPRSPMLYAIYRRSTPGYADGQEPVIHLATSAEAVTGANPPLEWLFTDGHAEMAISDYYRDLADLNKVDWDIMKSRQWADTDEDGDRKRRRQAEFLVRDFLPWQLVTDIGVCTKAVRDHVMGMLKGADHQPFVRIERGWYY